MAEKKRNSRALKAVNDTKKKTGNPTTSVKKKEIVESGKPVKNPKTGEPDLPLRTMVIPVLLACLLYNKTSQWGTNLGLLAIFQIVNCVILFLPSLMPTGNKDARSMSAFESLLIGLGGAASVVPGISPVGAATAVASMCGAERTFALNLTYLMHMVLTVCMIAFDLAAIFAVGLGSVTIRMFAGYILAAATAFGGAYLGIRIMRVRAVNIGYGLFVSYSFGAALLSFVLYLMV